MTTITLDRKTLLEWIMSIGPEMLKGLTSRKSDNRSVMCPNSRTEHRTEIIGGVSILLEAEREWSPLIINEVIRAFDDAGDLILSWARIRNYDPILEFRLQSEFEHVCASLFLITEPERGSPKTILIDNGHYNIHGVFKSPEIQYLAVYKGILIIHEDPTSVSLEEVHTFLCTI